VITSRDSFSRSVSSRTANSAISDSVRRYRRELHQACRAFDGRHVRKSDGTWTTVTAATLNSDGTAAGKLMFSRAGTCTVRAYRPAGATLTASYSTTWTVHVS
jgi:hypothetical protein